MAINKYMRAALRALSNANLDIKVNYKLIRQIEHNARKPRIKFTYQTWDYYINVNNNSNGEYKIPLRVFTPTGRKITAFSDISYPVIIFFHGGGWVTGDLDIYEKVCMSIAKRTCHAVAAVDYRLAPENPFPAALEDCYTAVKEIIKLSETLGVPFERITLMGDSAGGNLAAAVSMYMRDKGEQPLKKQILIYPVTYNDHSGTSPFESVLENGTDYLLTSKRVCDYTDLYCGKQSDRQSPYFAPLLAEDFSNQPDTLILTAQYDLLRDEGEEYGDKLKNGGNHVVTCRMKDALHGYFSLPAQFSAVRESYEIINKFLREKNQ